MGTAEDGVNPRQWDIRDIFPNYRVTLFDQAGAAVQVAVIPTGSGLTITKPPGGWNDISRVEFMPVTSTEEPG